MIFKCEQCNKTFRNNMSLNGHKAWHVKRSGKDIASAIQRNKQRLEKNKQLYYADPRRCNQCHEIICYEKAIQKRSENIYCNSSCAASYNNVHKKYGTRISKLETWLASKLNTMFPQLEIHYNRKDVIMSELDIFIPALQLAFELNGVHHYKPIHGCIKLNRIQRNDNLKVLACIKHNIQLHVIDTSQHNYVKESTCIPYLHQIAEVIKKKLPELDSNQQPFG